MCGAVQLIYNYQLTISHPFSDNVVYNGSPPFVPITTLVMTTLDSYATCESLTGKMETSSQVRVAFDSIMMKFQH